MAHYNFSLCIYLEPRPCLYAISFPHTSHQCDGQRHSFRLNEKQRKRTKHNKKRDMDNQDEENLNANVLRIQNLWCEFTLNIHFRVITFCFMYTFIIHADKHLYLCLRIIFHSKFLSERKKEKRNIYTKHRAFTKSIEQEVKIYTPRKKIFWWCVRRWSKQNGRNKISSTCQRGMMEYVCQFIRIL